jgi:pimeloyl-[acyl-carrier protein] methyl ester esterase
MIQILAMHGWAGDGRSWAPFAAAAAARGWPFTAADRGYGSHQAQEPEWRPEGLRVLLTHSMGPLLLPPAVLAAAEAVVLLAGFARFVPGGAAGRRLGTALAGMAASLDGPAAEATTMLRSFLAEACAPQPLSALPSTILEQPLAAEGRLRLQSDLRRLETCTDLPPDFPRQVPCLLVEASQDRIVVPEARTSLRQSLPAADRLCFAASGHALLGTPVVAMVNAWIEGLAPGAGAC